MSSGASLRKKAEEKRRMALVARRAGPGLSLSADRILMLQHAQEIEAEAAALEREADGLEGHQTPPQVTQMQMQVQQSPPAKDDGEKSN